VRRAVGHPGRLFRRRWIWRSRSGAEPTGTRRAASIPVRHNPRVSRRRRLWSLFVPLLGGVALVAGYFSEIPLLEAIVAPRVDRERGLLENLENLLLLASLLLAVRAARFPVAVGGESGF